MKKKINIVHGLTIALWPIIFLTGSARLEMYIDGIVSRTYDFHYNYWLLIPYAVSGFIFAVIGSCQKENCKRKDIVYAHIIAAILLIGASLGGLLSYVGVAPFHFVYNKPSLIAFVLGFTLFTAVKAVIYYRK